MNKKIAPGKGAGNKSEIERKTQRWSLSVATKPWKKKVLWNRDYKYSRQEYPQLTFLLPAHFPPPPASQPSLQDSALPRSAGSIYFLIPTTDKLGKALALQAKTTSAML